LILVVVVTCVALYPPRCASDSSSYHVFKGRYLLNKYVVVVVLKERRIGLIWDIGRVTLRILIGSHSPSSGHLFLSFN
jgi:hypothetical protein